MLKQRKLRKVIADCFDIEESSVTGQLAYNKIREWDSVGHFSLVAAIEDAFDIIIEPDDIGRMTDVAAILDLLERGGVHLPVDP